MVRTKALAQSGKLRYDGNMTKTEYLGRKLTAKPTYNRTTGERRIEIKCNGRFCWADLGTNEAAALDNAKLYVDEAVLRPEAYPNLSAK